MEHLITLVQKALNQASRKQQVLPPIANSLETLFTNQNTPTDPDRGTPENRESQSIMEIETPETPEEGALEVSLPTDEGDSPGTPQTFTLVSTSSSTPESPAMTQDKGQRYPTRERNTKKAKKDGTFMVKDDQDDSSTVASTPTGERPLYPVKTIELEGQRRLVLVLPELPGSIQTPTLNFQ